MLLKRNLCGCLKLVVVQAISDLLLNDFQIQHYLLNDLYAEVQQHFQGYSNIDWLLGDIEQLAFPTYLELRHIDLCAAVDDGLDAILQKANDSLASTRSILFFPLLGEQN